MNLTDKEKAQVNKEVDGQNKELLRKLHCQSKMIVQARQAPQTRGVLRDEEENGQLQALRSTIENLEHGQHHLQEKLHFERSARSEAEWKTQRAEVERDCANQRADNAEARETKLRGERMGSHPRKDDND